MSGKVVQKSSQKQPAAEPDYFVHPSACVDRPCSIGPGTKIRHFSHIVQGARIGRNCSIGQNVFVASSAVIGDGVTIQNNVSVYDAVVLEDGVFCGPSVALAGGPRGLSQFSRSEDETDPLPRTGGLSQFSRSENGTVPLCADPEGVAVSQSPPSEDETVPLPDEVQQTLIQRGAILGANVVVLAGLTVGEYAEVAAGAVVDADVARYAVAAGVPASRIGWRCRCGEAVLGSPGRLVTACSACGRHYHIEPAGLREYSPTEERARRKAHLYGMEKRYIESITPARR